MNVREYSYRDSQGLELNGMIAWENIKSIKERCMVRLRFILSFCLVVVLMTFGMGLGPRSIFAAEQAPPVPEEDIQVLDAGPIHEAFAEAVALDPEPGMTAPKEPPALIEEIPPKQKPEGNVQWIPGYWAWDDERNEYIWVSGIWRVPPPGRQWVPGYWASVKNEYQWISGYWAGVKEEVTEYLPEPPESVEIGPSSNAPSSNYTWIPGCWVWQHGRYAWRPGYWAVMHPDWIWVPAYYVWTPRGYIFAGGYWDYTVIHRGVLFAPVFFTPRVHIGFAFSFSPGYVIDLHVFYDALFLRPRYNHYYYGKYYAPKYYKRGIYPWFSLHARRAVYDPIYAHQRWVHRHDHEWENHLQRTFRERRKQLGLRPPRSIAQHSGPGKAGRSSMPPGSDFIVPLEHARKPKATTYRFHPLNEKERRQFSQREKNVRTFQKERQNRETLRHRMPVEKASKAPGPNKEKFSRSPIMDRSSGKARRKKAPPALYRSPQPNPDIEPLQREDDVSRFRDRSQRAESRARMPADREPGSRGRARESGGRSERLEERMQNFNDRQPRAGYRRQSRNDR